MRLQILAFLTLFSVRAEPFEIRTVCGTGQAGYSGDHAEAKHAEIRNPYGLCLGPDGALFICDMENHVIRRIKDDQITTVVGTGKRGYSGDGGPALKAELNEPYEIRFDSDANMFFVEMKNHLVRRVSARDGTISTVAGKGTAGFSGDDGPATTAQLNQPHSIQLDGVGNLYICDIGNHRIRKIDLRTGFISTFAGTGEKKSPRDGVQFHKEPLFGPRALDFDRTGNLWLALREGNIICKLDLKQGTIHHVAGTGETGLRDGPFKQAKLSGPKGLSVAPDGNIWFADTESHTIRRLNLLKAEVETIAGTGQRGQASDSSPLRCPLARPHGIFAAADGTMYIGDSENNRIRRLTLLP